MIAIVAAMDRELGPLRRRLPTGSVTLHASGVGKEASAGCVRELAMGSERPDILISIGFAGALRPDLAAGDLLLAQNLHAIEEPRSFSVDSWLLHLAEETCQEAGLRCFVADSLTVPQMVTTPAEKAGLGKATDAWAINMEDYWSAAAAAEGGIAYLSIRSVLDRSDQTLPSVVKGLGDMGGVAQAVSAVIIACRRPWLLPGLALLARQTGRAQRSLGDFIQVFIPRVLEAGPDRLCASGVRSQKSGQVGES